jgi:PAS domain S-box-containing protein
MTNQHHLAGKENNNSVSGKKLSLDSIYGNDFPRLLLDNLEVAIYTCDSEGYITMYNRAASDLWGREPEIGVDLWCGSWKIFETDGITEIPLSTCPMATTLKEGKAVNGHEIIIQKPNGENRFVIPYPRPFLDEQGHVTGAINLLIDVSPYKRSEQREAHMAAIVDSSDDAIVSKTTQGIVTSWNLGAEKIFGYTSSEMVGQSLLKIIPTDRWEEEYFIQEQISKGNRIDHYETKRVTKDGRVLEVSLTISPILDRQGKVIGASKIARDITRQKADALALLESEERYKLAVETARLGTWALNTDTKEMFCSSECRTIFGLNDDVAMNLGLLLEMIAPPDLKRVVELIDRAGDPLSDNEYNLEHRIISRNGTGIRWVRVKGKMYFNAAGKQEKLFGTMLDITDEKMAKERLEKTVMERTLDLQKMNEQLRRSNYDLEQFAYIASHDLQEPLRKIQTYIDMIGQTPNQETVHSYFDKITRSARRMALLIRDVLNYSRIDKNEALFSKIDLNQILQDVSTEYEDLIREKEAILNMQDLPAITGIDSQLRQLFGNLLNNSLKFSGQNCQISITADRPVADEIKLYPELDPQVPYLRLFFSDNGIGFEQQYAEKIFMIFQRLHSQAEYSGTGIGLSLCKKIVENHHGLILASSEPRQGATFTIWLPLI